MTRVLVCGGRDFNNYVCVYDVLDDLYRKTKIDTVITGGARGADYWGEAWAYHNKITFLTFKADWNKYGKKGGYLRNKQMLDEGKPDLIIAFPGGVGTANMIKLARNARIEVREIDPYEALMLRPVLF